MTATQELEYYRREVDTARIAEHGDKVWQLDPREIEWWEAREKNINEGENEPKGITSG